MKYKIISVDFGERYVGIAVSNGILVRPLKVIKYPLSDYKFLKKSIFEVLNLVDPEIIVIGIPRHLEKEKKIKKIFLEEIFHENDKLKEKITWVNEDYSTKEAIKFKAKKRQRDDAIAAGEILSRALPFLFLERTKKNNE